MSLTSQINDIVEQAASLLSPPDMSDWSPPEDAPIEAQVEAERAEYDRRAQAKIDAYLADRTDRLLCLRAIREAAQTRADAYENQAAPWERMAARQKGLVAYCEQLTKNVLVMERASAGGNHGEPYKVTLPNGIKVGLRVTQIVQVTDFEMLPGKFVRTKTVREADKTAIKKLLLVGEPVPGAKLGMSEWIDWGR